MRSLFSMRSYYVYILRCSDGSYYVGVTNNIKLRLDQHQEGSSEKAYTASRLPVELVWYEDHQYIINAIAREKQIKRWSRAKKEALINNAEQELKILAKKKFMRKKG